MCFKINPSKAEVIFIIWALSWFYMAANKKKQPPINQHLLRITQKICIAMTALELCLVKCPSNFHPCRKGRQKSRHTQSKTCLSNHAVPNAINFLPMLPIGHQVEVVGEADNLCESLEDVNAETLAALLQRSHTLMDRTGKEKAEKQKQKI